MISNLKYFIVLVVLGQIVLTWVIQRSKFLNISNIFFQSTSIDVCKTCGKTHPSYSHWGDFYLGQEILSIKPKVHVFGHVHDQPGFEINSEILRPMNLWSL